MKTFAAWAIMAVFATGLQIKGDDAGAEVELAEGDLAVGWGGGLLLRSGLIGAAAALAGGDSEEGEDSENSEARANHPGSPAWGRRGIARDERGSKGLVTTGAWLSGSSPRASGFSVRGWALG